MYLLVGQFMTFLITFKDVDIIYLPYHYYLYDQEYSDDLGLPLSSEVF